MIMKNITLIFLLLVVYGCQDSGNMESSTDGDWIYSADPYSDFTNAIEREDYRFIGIYGYSLSVPGVSLNCINVETDVRSIEGTSDTNSSFEEAKFNALAKVYAEYYNFQMKKYLQDTGSFDCVNRN